MGCIATDKTVGTNNCKRTSSDYERFKVIVHTAPDSDKQYSELRFECTSSSFFSKQVIYDAHGIWDRALYQDGDAHPILIWDNIDVLNNGTLIKIYAGGHESREDIYVSLMAFDTLGKDVLAETLPESKLYKEQFRTLLKNRNQKDSDFFDIYWNEVNSKK